MADLIDRQGAQSKGKAQKPVPRPDRRFYATTKAFGRFGIRWFDPQLMDAEHWHGHIEFNWLTGGSMNYLFDGRPVEIPARRLVMFWAGIPHRTVSIEQETEDKIRQCNVYLPLDTFLYMPNIGRLTETMIGGGVIVLPSDAVDNALLERWYQDYRSGDAERADILKSEIANMLRRTTLVGWEELLSPPGSKPRSLLPVRPRRCAMSLPWSAISTRTLRNRSAPRTSRRSWEFTRTMRSTFSPASCAFPCAASSSVYG
ncbi:hypothetical protein QW131_30115 [Roseibium salinum]|nr:hypothetical protein [Roseibium salinum]